MEEELIDVRIGKNDEKSRKEFEFEEFLEKNKYTVGLLLLGLLLIGLGILGSKYYSLWGNGTKVEILGTADDGGLKTDDGWQKTEDGGQKITVEIAGEIMKPGVYELDIGSRVNDLLISGGGLSANADRDWVAKNINLAQRLADGVKIFIPSKTEVGSGRLEAGKEVGSEKWEKININTASEVELDTLWGIGEATARKIIENRSYSKPEELLEKKIIKSNVWNEIKEKISVY